VQPGIFDSIFSFWKWLHITFQVFYVIEVQENDAHRIIGFLGIYNMQLGRQLWLSLVLFDPKDRGLGHGGRALQLFLSTLQEDHIVRTVCGEVLKSNTQSLRLLQKLHFQAYGYDESRVLLRKRLEQSKEAAHL
jgi:RimJ/RimL family protein N-acetyltransferase